MINSLKSVVPNKLRKKTVAFYAFLQPARENKGLRIISLLHEGLKLDNDLILLQQRVAISSQALLESRFVCNSRQLIILPIFSRLRYSSFNQLNKN